LRRTDDALRELGGDVLRHARQSSFLAVHLESAGAVVASHPSITNLRTRRSKAFLIHARAFADFLPCEAARLANGIASTTSTAKATGNRQSARSALQRSLALRVTTAGASTSSPQWPLGNEP
jgi:hypothetical protein